MSPFPKFALAFLASTILLQAALGADPNPVGQTCSLSSNFTANCPYEANLNTLMGYLYFATPMKGFGIGVIGQSPSQVYGQALCRANVSASDCKTCVVNATAEIRGNCPYGKQAKIWYDHCFLNYSADNFFGQIDNQSQILLWNTKNASDPLAFDNKVDGLLTSLAKEASQTNKFYAAGEMNLEGSEKVYGLAQCTKYLSCGDCLKCLDGLIGEVPNGKLGARIFSGSCRIRYETYSFLNA